jgi:hypothetical protein
VTFPRPDALWPFLFLFSCFLYLSSHLQVAQRLFFFTEHLQFVSSRRRFARCHRSWPPSLYLLVPPPAAVNSATAPVPFPFPTAQPTRRLPFSTAPPLTPSWSSPGTELLLSPLTVAPLDCVALSSRRRPHLSCSPCCCRTDCRRLPSPVMVVSRWLLLP